MWPEPARKDGTESGEKLAESINGPFCRAFQNRLESLQHRCPRWLRTIGEALLPFSIPQISATHQRAAGVSFHKGSSSSPFSCRCPGWRSFFFQLKYTRASRPSRHAPRDRDVDRPRPFRSAGNAFSIRGTGLIRLPWVVGWVKVVCPSPLGGWLVGRYISLSSFTGSAPECRRKRWFANLNDPSSDTWAN